MTLLEISDVSLGASAPKKSTAKKDEAPAEAES
jgi:hypothetical protein